MTSESINLPAALAGARRLCAVLCLAALPALAEPVAPELLTSADARADLRIARDALEAIHPGYDRYTPADRLDAAWAAADARLAPVAGVSPARLYAELSSVLAQIRCAHTLAELPPALAGTRRALASFFPFRVRVFDGRVFVTAVAPGPAAAGLAVGDEIVTLDGHAMGDVLARILPLLPVDGFTDHARLRTFEASGDLLGSGFEHFYPILFGEWWRQGSAGLTVRRPETQAAQRFVTLEVRPVSFDLWRTLGAAGEAWRQDFKDAVQWQLIDPGIGVLRVDTFVNYRDPVDPDSVYAPIFARFDAAGIDTLILDTRRNGGGSDDAMLSLLAWLTPRPFTLLREARVRTIDLAPWADVLSTWDAALLAPDPAGFEALADGWLRVRPDERMPALLEQQPRADAFTGRMLVLADGRNASAVTMMLARLHERPRTAVVGTPTGGSATGPTAGIIYFLDLPASGIRVRVPWMRQWVNAHDVSEGQGVSVDVEVRETLADVLAGRDPVMARAIELASRKQRPRLR